MMASKRQRFSVALPDDLPAVIADRDRLRQVLLNLLSNAHKFTPPGGEIVLTARRATGAEMVAITVEDTGIGIGPEHQAIIFEAFQQVESGYARAQQGTGLGLALTKQLVELMGGTITLQSAPGVGSAFTVTLPAVPDEHTQLSRGNRGEPQRQDERAQRGRKQRMRSHLLFVFSVPCARGSPRLHPKGDR